MAQTDEQRKAANRERQRKYREKQRLQREAEAAAKRDTKSVTKRRTKTHAEVTSALAAMPWLKDSDGALKSQALDLADLIDELRADGEITKALSAHRALTRVLHDLGGAPTVRMANELRSHRANGTDPDGDDDKSSGDAAGEVAPAGKVSQFKRPAKRRAS